MSKWNRYTIVNKILLFPYYFVLQVRHLLYDSRILKRKRFSVPIISVGNITVGGTGKTPYVSYLIDEMRDSESIAVLSRGYGRKSRGFRFVELSDSASDSGDEPLLLKKRHPDVVVAVDKNRVRGIERLLAMDSPPSLILMDDGFQYRGVIASSNVVLISYYRPIHKDYLLPIGRLRDLPSRLKKADEIVITKCPDYLSDDERYSWRVDLGLYPEQILSFMRIKYLDLRAVFPEGDNRYIYSKEAILITGIANPKSMRDYLSANYRFSAILRFSDHHSFLKSDIEKINRISASYCRAIVITTEKDLQRLIESEALSRETKMRLFYLPMEFEPISREICSSKY